MGDGRVQIHDSAPSPLNGLRLTGSSAKIFMLGVYEGLIAISDVEVIRYTHREAQDKSAAT